jgi:hypothetical protein
LFGDGLATDANFLRGQARVVCFLPCGLDGLLRGEPRSVADL